MSDFLKNLRSSHKKDPSVPRRGIDAPYYTSADRRRQSDRPSDFPDGLELVWSSLNDLLPVLTDAAVQISNHLKKEREESKMLVEAKIRQHNAISNFVDNMNRLFCESANSAPDPDKPKATTSYTSGTHYTKDDVLEIIQMMRRKGATFAVIASYLKEKGIPTFSGRGEWHAQTIHRLCK